MNSMTDFICPECHWHFDDLDVHEEPDCDNIKQYGFCRECERLKDNEARYKENMKENIIKQYEN